MWQRQPGSGRELGGQELGEGFRQRRGEGKQDSRGGRRCGSGLLGGGLVGSWDWWSSLLVFSGSCVNLASMGSGGATATPA